MPHFLARFALVFLLEMMDSSVENASRFTRLQRTPKKAKYGHIEQKNTLFHTDPKTCRTHCIKRQKYNN